MLSSIASRLTRNMAIVPNLVRPSAANPMAANGVNGAVAAAVQKELQHQVRAHVEMEVDIAPPSRQGVTEISPAVFSEEPQSAMVVNAGTRGAQRRGRCLGQTKSAASSAAE